MANTAVILIGATANADAARTTNWYSFDGCSFQIGGGGTCYIGIGASNYGSLCNVLLNNCTVKFADVTQYIWPIISNTTWQNTGPILASGSSVPNCLFQFLSGSFMANVSMEALDLSQIPKILEVTTQSTTGNYTIKDCKMHPTVVIGAPKVSYHTVQLVRSSHDATAYKSSRITYEGTETTEIAIVRTGGYADPAGQQQSRKIVTSAGALWIRPYTTQTTNKWNYVVGAAVAVTMYGTIQAAALPTTDDIWVEVGYLIPTNLPLGGYVTSTKANVWNTDVAPVAADGSTWGGGGSGAGWLPFKLTATVPSTISSFLIVRVCVAKPSMTCYIDPTPVLS